MALILGYRCTQKAVLPAQIISIVSASMLLIALTRFAFSGSCNTGDWNNSIFACL